VTDKKIRLSGILYQIFIFVNSNILDGDVNGKSIHYYLGMLWMIACVLFIWQIGAEMFSVPRYRLLRVYSDSMGNKVSSKDELTFNMTSDTL